jgi:orotate phosphoribosyltransferase
MVLSDYEFKSAEIIENNALQGKKALHIADLVTEASSYLRAWIPAVESLGASMKNTIAIVDRNQGGREALKGNNVELHAFAVIHADLFDRAKINGYINENQYHLILQFIEDPRQFMVSFLKSHPGFLESQIAMGGKAKERAQLFIEKGYAAQ